MPIKLKLSSHSATLTLPNEDIAAEALKLYKRLSGGFVSAIHPLYRLRLQGEEGITYRAKRQKPVVDIPPYFVHPKSDRGIKEVRVTFQGVYDLQDREKVKGVCRYANARDIALFLTYFANSYDRERLSAYNAEQERRRAAGFTGCKPLEVKPYKP